MAKCFTKKQVILMFREAHAGLIPRGDSIARSEAWNNFTDSLHTDHLISKKAYETWTCP